MVILPSVDPQVSASTVNRKLSALSAFYLHAARHGVDLGELLVTWGRPDAGAGGSRSCTTSAKASRRPADDRVETPRKLPRVLTTDEVQAILDACGRLRDRLLFAVLYDTGMRIGEALGLRHEDIAPAECEVTVFPGITPTGPGPSRRTHGPSPSLQSWSGSMPIICMGSTATSTPTTCSSICGAVRTGVRWPIRRSMTWSGGCAARPASISTRTGTVTPRPRACSATAFPSRSCPRSSAMPRSPRRSKRTGI